MLSKSNAFGLFEILMAMSIVSVVMVTIYVSFSNSLTIIQSSTARALSARKHSILYKIVERDLQNIFYTQDNKLRYLLITENNRNADSASDRIDFISIFPQMSSFAPNSTLREISYFLKEKGIGEHGEVLYRLVRREQFGVDQEPAKGGTLSILADDVLSLKIEATMGVARDKWERKWDYRLKNTYPKAIRVQIKFLKKNLPPGHEQIEVLGLLRQDKP